MNILILGHNGLLGNMVHLYFKSKNYNIITTDLRWPDEDFKDFILNQDVDYIINCIGIIPQKTPDKKLYYIVNYELPLWLDRIGKKIIHPDTDESDGTLYSISKRMSREQVSENTRVIKTSIIGHEKNGNYSFLDWFLSSREMVVGFINQKWNGNTTLEWSKWAEKIMLNWEQFEKITLLENPECLSKYDILLIIKDVYKKDIQIIPTESQVTKNNCMKGDYITKNIKEQIYEMREFFEGKIIFQ